MNKMYIKIRQSMAKGCFNVDFDVPEDQAIHPFDAGEVNLIMSRANRIKDEIEGYKSLGYEPSISYQSDFVMDSYLRASEKAA